MIVGPNGSGKTNFIRAIRMLVDSLDPGWNKRDHWLSAARANKEEFSVAINVCFDENWERDILASYFIAVICSYQGSAIVGGQTHHLNQLGRRLWEARKDGLEWFFSGSITVSYSIQRGWQRKYSIRRNQTTWDLDFESNFFGEYGIYPSRNITPLEKMIDSNSNLKEFLNGDGELPAIDLWGLLFNDLANADCAIALGTLSHDDSNEPLRLFFQRAHMKQNKSGGYSVYPALVFHLILSNAIIFSENVRALIKNEVKLSDLSNSLNLSDGSNVAAHLFQLKNGDFIKRNSYLEIQKSFNALTELEFDVSIDYMSMASKKEDDESIFLLSSVKKNENWIPLEYAGAGISEAIILCTLALNESKKIVLLDEPGSNLHPLWQRTLLNTFLMSKKSQFFLITHSPYLIPAARMQSVIRFQQRNGATQACRILKEPGTHDDGKLWKEMGRSADARSLLFADKVILVEGETEKGALPVWWQKQGWNLDGDAVAIYDVGADTNLMPWANILDTYQIPWVIINDGDALQDTKVFCKSLKFDSSMNFFEKKNQAEKMGVFTLNDNYDQTFESLDIIKQHMAEAKKIYGRSKVRVGRYIADKTDCPEEVSEIYRKIEAYWRKDEH